MKKYTDGVTNEKELRQSLRACGVKTDSDFDKLIRKHEEGKYVFNSKLGSKVLKGVVHASQELQDNQINLLDSSYKSKKGNDHLKGLEGDNQESGVVKDPTKDKRILHAVTQNREIFGKRVYVGNFDT